MLSAFALIHLSIDSLISGLEGRQQHARKIPSLVALNKLVMDSPSLPPGLWAKLQSTRSLGFSFQFVSSTSFPTEAHKYLGHDSSLYSLCNYKTFRIHCCRHQNDRSLPQPTHVRTAPPTCTHALTPRVSKLLNTRVPPAVLKSAQGPTRITPFSQIFPLSSMPLHLKNPSGQIVQYNLC